MLACRKIALDPGIRFAASRMTTMGALGNAVGACLLLDGEIPQGFSGSPPLARISLRVLTNAGLLQDSPGSRNPLRGFQDDDNTGW
ncbi:hypothetical protein C7S18_17345 [Ahniella affigens]|uniref:Uncharacterized protein n=1 Tax=Ahniella affigens TaxID=2021234 RepID=A0A2P1PVF9_9GAMM|nr:hypothetical protein C7S18_17345 [Ahniella affigens]